MRHEPTRKNGTYTKVQAWDSPTGASLCVYYKKATGRKQVKTKGVIQINHGLAEHAGRYARFAEALSKAGYHVYATDHRGHGATTAEDARQGVFAAKDGADVVLQDVKFVNANIRKLHPKLPLIMFGHSMGAMITYNYLLRWPKDADAYAVWNAAMSKGGANGLLKLILGAEGIFKKPGANSVIDTLTFKTFNKKFKPNKTQSDWLSKDVDECQKYDDDPDCGWPASVSMWKDMLAWILYGASDAGLENVPKSMPIYLLGGDADPSTMEAKATKDMQSRLQAAGLTNVKTTIRKDGRHEALNEPKAERDTVVAEFIDWVASI
jgi:alpha-beta hydrolase superfamily lysophospholipase